MGHVTYRDAGVDIDAGDRLVDRIKPLAARTRIPEVLADVGGFAGLCRVPSDVEDPVLVSGTDGVGTKLKLAFLRDVHDTIGIDLVAMCVNDVLTTGARPLFFLDYFATGRLDVGRAEAVVRGIARGCELAGCALLGGETAELPGFYADGEYDLAGFAVGVVSRARLIDGSRVEVGDALIALASSGLHSNGYSLARRVLVESPEDLLDAHDAALGEPLGAALLRPTRIYAAAVRALLASVDVRALCHVTGGGIPGNLPRVMPAGVGARVSIPPTMRLPIFDEIARRGPVTVEEMRRTFNMGVGMIVAVPATARDDALRALREIGEHAEVLGEVVESEAEGDARVEFVADERATTGTQ